MRLPMELEWVRGWSERHPRAMAFFTSRMFVRLCSVAAMAIGVGFVVMGIGWGDLSIGSSGGSYRKADLRLDPVDIGVGAALIWGAWLLARDRR